MKTSWLSLHASYRCRDSGACCSAGWPIPLESERVAAIEHAMDAGRIVAPAVWLQGVAGQPPEIAGILAQGHDRHCVFHARPGCQIHHALGASGLPSACAHFPRECLIDPRGVFVTLSHYCPTAASLLFEHVGPVDIVDGPPAVSDGEPEGLDARDALPPLLAPGVLMDHASYSAWERHMVHVLAGDDAHPERDADGAVDALERQARALSQWKPGRGALIDAVRALDGRLEETPQRDPDWSDDRRLFELAVRSVPASHSWPAYPPDGVGTWQTHVAPGWSDQAPVIERFVAAHAFASWIAYQGPGLLAVVRRLRLALAVLRAEAIRACAEEGAALDRQRLTKGIRQTDLLLVHLADRGELARRIRRERSSLN